MKTRSALAALLVTVGIVSTTRAQSGMAVENWGDIRLGPMFTAGESLSAGTVKSGTKTGPLFAFTGGAVALFPFTLNFGLQVGVAYDSRGANFHDEANSNTYINYNFSYLSLQPVFDFSGFLIGFGFGLPMGTSTIASSDIPAFTAPTTSDMNFLVEGRIGANITIINSDESQLKLMIVAAYPFTKIQKNIGLAGAVDADNNNGALATAQIGLCYMFDLTPH